MTPADLEAALARLGWKKRHFAIFAGYTYRAVKYWLRGERRIPVIIERMLRDQELRIRDAIHTELGRGTNIYPVRIARALKLPEHCIEAIAEVMVEEGVLQ